MITTASMYAAACMIVHLGDDPKPRGVSATMALVNGAYPTDHELAGGIRAFGVESVLLHSSRVTVEVRLQNSGPADARLDASAVAQWAVELWDGNKMVRSTPFGAPHYFLPRNNFLQATLVNRAGNETLRFDAIELGDALSWVVDIGPAEALRENVALELRLKTTARPVVDGREGVDLLLQKRTFVTCSAVGVQQRIEQLMQLAIENRQWWNWNPKVVEQYMRAALEIDAANWRSRWALANALREQGRTDEAVREGESAVSESSPGSAEREAMAFAIKDWRTKPVVARLPVERPRTR